MAIEKIKILGAVLELPAKQHCQFSPFGPIFEVNRLDWQCYLAGSSKRAPRIFIFSIVQGAENLSYTKFIETHACAFLALIILSIGTVMGNNTINNHFWPRHDFKINHQFLYIVCITIQAILDALLKAKAILKYRSEEKGSSFYKCSILLGFIMPKKLRGL